MLALTHKTNYGLIALVCLAEEPGRLRSARGIARRYDLPASIVMNVLKELAAAGYIESVRGARGGYRLARKPEEVALAEVMDYLEGPIRMSQCLRGRVPDDQSCDRVDTCTIADPVHRIHRKLRNLFQQITLADVMAPGEGGNSKVQSNDARDVKDARDVPDAADLS